MVNKVTLIGNLGADPELKELGETNAVCNMRVATTTRLWSKEKQERTETTEWHSVVCFGGLAKTCHQYLSKGRQVYLEGRIQTRKWQDKEGNDRYSTEIVADEVSFLGKKEAGERTSSPPSGGPAW